MKHPLPSICILSYLNWFASAWKQKESIRNITVFNYRAAVIISWLNIYNRQTNPSSFHQMNTFHYICVFFHFWFILSTDTQTDSKQCQHETLNLQTVCVLSDWNRGINLSTCFCFAFSWCLYFITHYVHPYLSNVSHKLFYSTQLQITHVLILVQTKKKRSPFQV